MSTLIPWKRADIQRGGNYSMAPVSQMRWDWDRLFDRFLDDFWNPTVNPVTAVNPVTGALGLPLDMTETDDQIVVRAEVPGIAPKDLDIRLAGDVLTLSGQKIEVSGSDEGRRTYSERQYGSYQRALKLPCPVDPDRVHAEHENGVITITLRKAENVRPKRIQVKSA
jgi:HSP20 family protein